MLAHKLGMYAHRRGRIRGEELRIERRAIDRARARRSRALRAYFPDRFGKRRESAKIDTLRSSSENS
jgi:hypothetical protein